MSKSTLTRVSLALLLCLLAIIGPWWLGAILLVVGAWFYPHFYEAIIPALLFDLLHGAPAASPFGFQFLAAVFSILVVALLDELRGYIKMG